MRGYHDIGGLPDGPIKVVEHDYSFWEKRVDALVKVLQAPNHNLLSSDELRRHIESLGPDKYEKLSYYERWIAATCNALLERGLINIDELGRKMVEVQNRKPNVL